MKKFQLFFMSMLCLAFINCNNHNAKIKNGALPGRFSVSPDTQVRFSQGNLQYQPSTKNWRFAEHQYDVIGEANAPLMDTCSVWKDLFGWGTGNNPTLISTAGSDYKVFIDWGVNQITNGGDVANTWRTLTYPELNYLLTGRRNALELCFQATVEGVHGFILLPDNWNTSYRPLEQFSSWRANEFLGEEWAKMESLGAVFLPAAGSRIGIGWIDEEKNWEDDEQEYVDDSGVMAIVEEAPIRRSTIGDVSVCGTYWTSTPVDVVWYAESFFFHESEFFPRQIPRHNGVSVRLVQDCY